MWVGTGCVVCRIPISNMDTCGWTFREGIAVPLKLTIALQNGRLGDYFPFWMAFWQVRLVRLREDNVFSEKIMIQGSAPPKKLPRWVLCWKLAPPKNQTSHFTSCEISQRCNWGISNFRFCTYVPWSKVAILGLVIPPLIGILIMGK